MKAEKPRKTSSGCVHQVSVREVAPNGRCVDKFERAIGQFFSWPNLKQALIRIKNECALPASNHVSLPNTLTKTLNLTL